MKLFIDDVSDMIKSENANMAKNAEWSMVFRWFYDEWSTKHKAVFTGSIFRKNKERPLIVLKTDQKTRVVGYPFQSVMGSISRAVGPPVKKRKANTANERKRKSDRHDQFSWRGLGRKP